MRFTKSLVICILGAALASAVAVNSGPFHEGDATAHFEPAAHRPPPTHKSPAPKPKPKPKPKPTPKPKPKIPLGTNPFSTGGKATAAKWAKWAAFCSSRKRAEVGQDGVLGNHGYETLETSGLRTCFGVVIVGRVTIGAAPPKSNAILWHMSGTPLMMNNKWDDVVKIINDGGLEDMTAYLSVPADSQPHVPDWASEYEPVHQEALAELEKALKKIGVNIKIKTRADASVGATMKVDEHLHVSVNNAAF
jgi:hypothetical protein